MITVSCKILTCVCAVCVKLDLLLFLMWGFNLRPLKCKVKPVWSRCVYLFFWGGGVAVGLFQT